jgi:carbon storage regulator
MLVLSRNRSEVIVVGDSDEPLSCIRITVVDCGSGLVKLGIDAPSAVPVHRMEVWERSQSARSPPPVS